MKKKLLIFANVLLIVGLAAFGGLYFKKYRDLTNNPASAAQVAQAEIDRYVSEVGKLYDLPKDKPTQVTTVTDKDEKIVKDQPFYAKAENGDVTLIYTNAKLAILYRPSTKQIINVSSVNIQSNVRVKVIGVAAARKVAVALLTAAQITSTEGSDAKTAPTTVTVVDISGNNAEQAKKVATTVKGTVGSLPTGEDKPADVDILVITGP